MKPACAWRQDDLNHLKQVLYSSESSTVQKRQTLVRFDCVYGWNCMKTWNYFNNFCIHIFASLSDVVHTQGPLDGSLYARVRKKDSLEGVVTINGLPVHENPLTNAENPLQHPNHPLQTTDQTLPVTGHASLPAVDHTLSVSSDSGNSTASIKTDRTDEHSQSVQSAVNHNNPTATHPPLSPQEKRELDHLSRDKVLFIPNNSQPSLCWNPSQVHYTLCLIPIYMWCKSWLWN